MAKINYVIIFKVKNMSFMINNDIYLSYNIERCITFLCQFINSSICRNE